MGGGAENTGDGTEYAAMLRQLFGIRRAGIALQLGRVQAALAALGHPERRFPIRVHIGGTNGKGSTSAFVEAILRQYGLRTGLFTSPHLSRFAERFRIAGAPAAEDDILAVYRRLQDRVAALGGDRLGSEVPMTFFEWITVIGLVLFAEAGVEAAILEVGLGGRFDATNAVLADVACVTGVARDHVEYLGDDLRSIAYAKAGIFKPGKRAVIGRAGLPEAVPWLVDHARAAGCTVRVVEDPIPADWSLALAGRHQRDNAAAAVAIVGELRALGLLPGDPEGDPERVRTGLAQAVMHGRLEVLADRPRVVIDGAHNPHGARVLAEAVAQWPTPRALVLGVSGGKDAAGIARALWPVFADSGDRLILTRAEHPRSIPVAELRVAVEPVSVEFGLLGRLECVTDATSALARARAWVGPGGTVVVAGSLFLVGEMRRHLLCEPGDPIAISDPP